MRFVAGVVSCTLVVVAFAQHVVFAQNKDEMTAREAFFVKPPADSKPKPQIKPAVNQPKPPVSRTTNDRIDHSTSNTQRPDSGNATPVNSVAYAPLALRYSILQEKGDRFEEVDPDTQFHSGDRIRVKVEANDSAYLYIVMGGSSGQWTLLFPNPEINHGNNKIERGNSYTIPAEQNAAFSFDENAGTEKVSLVLTRNRESNLENLIYAAGDPTRNNPVRTDDSRVMIAQTKPIDASVLGRVRELTSRDLVFEKYDGTAPDGKPDKAVYAATKSKNSDARLFVDLKLTHK